jgi:hypothetical protein
MVSGMTEEPRWWQAVSPSTREWLVAHQHERISWHVLPELWGAGAELMQPDPAHSVFSFNQADAEFIASQTVDPAASRTESIQTLDR